MQSYLISGGSSTLVPKALYRQNRNEPMGGRVDRASAFKTVDSGSIPGRVKPKTTKNWYSQTFSYNKGECEASTRVCGRQMAA